MSQTFRKMLIGEDSADHFAHTNPPLHYFNVEGIRTQLRSKNYKGGSMAW